MDGTRSSFSQCHVTRSETFLSWKLLGQDCRAFHYSLRTCLYMRKYQLSFKNNFAIQSLRLVQLRIDFKVHPSFYPNSTVGGDCLSLGYSGKSVKLDIHVHLVPRLQCVEPYLHWSIRLLAQWQLYQYIFRCVPETVPKHDCCLRRVRHPYVTEWLPPDWSSWNLIFWVLNKIFRHVAVWVKIRQE